MIRCTVQPLRTIGFYVVLHPWLFQAGLVKVGYSTNVEQRLETASYTTCFTPEWTFHSVFECETELDALILEQSVLYCMASRRVPRRELLLSTGEDVCAKAKKIAHSLKINTVIHSSFESYSSTEMAQEEPQKEDASPVTPPNSLKEKAKDFVLQKPTQNLTLSRINKEESFSNAISPFIETLDTLSSIFDDEERKNAKGEGKEVHDFSEYTSEEMCDILETFCVSEEHTYKLHSLRKYQLEAVKRLRNELMTNGKAICQMACRCGKTPVAYQLIKEYLLDGPLGKIDNHSRSIVIYLVPGLALLRQTAQKLYQYGLGDQNVEFFLVGSDAEPVQLTSSVSLSMTTDSSVISNSSVGTAPLIIISTYHSSVLLSEVHRFASLVVFDECHRVCGSTEPTAFNYILQLPSVGARLFLTATPPYDTPIKMSNQSYFGGVAYRYYLREGINAGYVNPFAVRVILGQSLDDLNPFLLEAMKLADKLLVFCRDVEHAETLYSKLCKEAESPTLLGVKPFHCFVAYSRLGGAVVSSRLLKFMNSKRAILFNIRLFQEGVEIPDLNAVFFATPRYSSRDIIQSICRPLNKLDGKPTSFVFLPAIIDASLPETHPINLENFSTLIPFTDALMDEDPSLFEYMIDPENKTYNFNVVGVRSLSLTTEQIHQFVLPGIRRGVRFSSRNSDRLLRASRLPWIYVFKELRRIVMECNRYPKTNDAWVVGKTPLSMNRFYQFCRKGYHLHELKQPTYLKTHQIRDLESLPMWRVYGVHGPYPWKECLKTMSRLLQDYGTCPPLDVHKGGYIGLDATPLERLCGFLMGINQADAELKLRLSIQKQEDLDQLCKRYGVKWRKERDIHGVVIPNGRPTFITVSYISFKYMYENLSKFPSFQSYLKLNFPGYPEKHLRMERIKDLKSGVIPPRYNPSSTKHRDPSTSAEFFSKKVMCRVCRLHVSSELWEEHLTSSEHKRKIVADCSSPRKNRTSSNEEKCESS